MSLREHLVKRMWWLGCCAESSKSISRRNNVLPGRQMKQIKFSFPISDWSCRLVHDLQERQVRSKSMISWRRDSEIRASCAKLLSTIPNSSRQVQGLIVLDGLVAKPGSLQAWSMVWRLLEHTGSGAGGSTCQEIIQVQCNATQEKHRKNTWYRLRNRRIFGIMRAKRASRTEDKRLQNTQYLLSCQFQ